ncbi:MAG: hypothetical protein IPK25_05790 [Saprospiraceae bacterium]|nr:hypothetical protein [Saprospiraceae bacterium]
MSIVQRELNFATVSPVITFINVVKLPGLMVLGSRHNSMNEGEDLHKKNLSPTITGFFICSSISTKTESF